MKRRVLITLMAITMTAAMITGCGKKPVENIVDEITQESTMETETEPSQEPSTEVEPSTEEQPAESDPETDTTTPDETPAPTEAPTETEPSQEESKPEAVPEADTVPLANTPATANTTEAPTEQAPDYTVTAMNATMYVKNSVNLRQGPGTGYSKVGSLNKGDQVTVTGQAENGWYQLDSGAFVSNKYLTTNAPAAVPVDTTTVPGVTVPDQIGIVNPLEVSPYVANASEFFDYLNQQRSAAGLGTLTWDSDMAAVAQRRAKELASDFSHNGNVERYNENIHTTNNMNSTYVDWYNSFYNSQAHRETMMNPNIGRGAAALYFDGRNYYVICNFAGNPLSAEEQLEQLKPENLAHAGGNESGTVNSYSTSGETLDPNNPNDAELIDRIEDLVDQANQGLIDVPSLN